MSESQESAEGRAVALRTLKQTIKNMDEEEPIQLVQDLTDPVIIKELMHTAVYYGQTALLKALATKGVPLTEVPETLFGQNRPNPDRSEEHYKPTPYIVLATVKGQM